jgi:hypothetical protein
MIEPLKKVALKQQKVFALLNLRVMKERTVKGAVAFRQIRKSEQAGAPDFGFCEGFRMPAP